jgi:hypothetical protein
MAKTYYFSATTRACPGTGDKFEQALENSPLGAPGSIPLAFVNSYSNQFMGLAITPVDEPGTNGTSTGAFTVEVDVSVTIADLSLRVYLVRVNGSDVVQATVESSEGSVTLSTVQQYLFTWTNPALGTWSAGDRLMVRFGIVNASSHGGDELLTLVTDSASAQILTPFTAGATTGTATGVFGFTGAVHGINRFGTATGIFGFTGAAIGMVPGVWMLNRQVVASSDDGVEVVATVPTTIGTALLMSAVSEHMAIRITDLPYQNGATVSDARLILTIADSSKNDAEGTWYAHDIDDSPTLQHEVDGDIDGRTKTTASVAWTTNDLGTAGNQATTPNLKALVQEVVDRPGWQPGNNITFLYVHNSATDLISVAAWDAASFEEPAYYSEYRLVPQVVGIASGLFGFTGPVAGEITGGGEVTGTATGVFGYTGTVAGLGRAYGAASGVYGYTGTVAGTGRTPGTAIGDFGFTGTAAGVARAFGAVDGTFTFTGSAAGGVTGGAGFTVATRTTQNGSATTSHPVLLPDGSNVTGRLVIVVFAAEATVSWPAGWSEIFEGSTTSTVLAVAYRFIDGTEGFDGTDDTVTATTGSASLSNAHAYLSSAGHHASTAPEAATAATGLGANANPPTLNPAGWDIEEALWIAAAAYRFNASFSGAPTNYTDLLSLSGGDTNAPLGSARRVLSASSEDPGTFTSSDGGAWVATTVAVRPGVAGGEVNGTATGDYTFTGAVAGMGRTPGTATGDYTFTGTVAGTPRAVGTATGTFTFAGGTAGVARAVGTATGSFGFTGDVAGEIPTGAVNGSATGTFTFTGATTGQRRATGTATGTFTYVGTTAGMRRLIGALTTGDYGFTGTVSGGVPPTVPDPGWAVTVIDTTNMVTVTDVLQSVLLTDPDSSVLVFDRDQTVTVTDPDNSVSVTDSDQTLVF